MGFRPPRTTVSVVLALTFLAPTAAHDLARFAQITAASNEEPALVGNNACRPCHAEVVDSFERTAMAQTSGPARGHVISGSFAHAPSGIRYTIAEGGDGASLAYESAHEKDVSGRLTLHYYVGSNTRGRTRGSRVRVDVLTVFVSAGARPSNTRPGEALALWQASFNAQPYVEQIGLNLALGQCLAGEEPQAEATVDRLLRFHQDSGPARALRGEIDQKNHCAHHRS